MPSKKKAKKHSKSRYLTAPLGKEFVRGFIPHSVKVTDKPSEIASIFGIHIMTARMWIRILNGPQISRKGRVITKWEAPDFGAPTKKGGKA